MGNVFTSPWVRTALLLVLPLLGLSSGCGAGDCIEAGTYTCKTSITNSTCAGGGSPPMEMPVTFHQEMCGVWSQDINMDLTGFSMSCKSEASIISSTSYEGSSDCTLTYASTKSSCSYTTTMQCSKD